jgi:hypothetical protein
MIVWIALFLGNVVQYSFSFTFVSSSSSNVNSPSRILKRSLELQALPRSQQVPSGDTASATASAPPMYIRWKSPQAGSTSTVSWDMQTAVTTFQRGNSTDTTVGGLQTVELHAQLHFGERAYFEAYNSRSFNVARDAVLFELLLDEHLLDTDIHSDTGTAMDTSNSPSSGQEQERQRRQRRILPNRDGSSPVSASPPDQATAKQYGWSCQVDVMDYSQPNWIHADLTRQEFLQRLDNDDNDNDDGAQTTNMFSVKPLWQLATKGGSPFPLPLAAKEAATALFSGPPILGDAPERRLFTNLYFSGGNLAASLRAVLWMTVPSPEVSVLLLDWASLLVGRVNGVSKVSLFIAQSLVAGRLDKVRQLVFGQVVLAANQQQQQLAAAAALRSRNKNQNQNNQDWSLLVTQRNERALQVLDQTLDSLLQEDFNNNNDISNKGKVGSKVALLYGCSHCPDLHRGLVQRGFTPVESEWRTAWSVPFAGSNNVAATVATSDESTSATLDNDTAAAGREQGVTRTQTISLVVALTIYFVVGGIDWIATLDDVAQSVSDADAVEAAVDALLYLARHVLLYVGLSKFVLDWDAGSFRDENSND